MIKQIVYPVSIVLCVLSVYFLLHDTSPIIGIEGNEVFIKKTEEGNQLYRKKKPFYIKGAGGKPLIEELAMAGGNTLRLYDTINLKAILDKAQENDIAVIVDIPIPRFLSYNNLYNSKVYVDTLKQNVRQLVKKYKNHPALLFWNLGNEITFPFVLKKNNFIKTFNALIDIIHNEDPNHLVGTSISGTSRKQTLSLHWHASELDIIGFNAFSNMNKVKRVMRLTSLIGKPKPYYFSEWGYDGPWEVPLNKWNVILELNHSQKAKVLKQRYKSYIEPDKSAMGSVVFYWGNKVEGTPTWFNVFDSNNRKSECFYALKSLWGGEMQVEHYPPRIKKFELDNRIATDTIIFSPNEIREAEVFFESDMNKWVEFDWEMKYEAWGRQKWTNSSLLESLADTTKLSKSRIIKFKVPNQEGPYRLFVNIYDKYNNFTSANIPFYVIKLNE